MSDTYQPGQAVYVSATFEGGSGVPPGSAYVLIEQLPRGNYVNGSVRVLVPLSALSAAPSPQQIEDLRESIGDVAAIQPNSDGAP